MASHLVHRQGQHLTQRGTTIARCAPRVLDDAWDATRARGARLPQLLDAHLAHAADRLVGWRRLAAAYDVERQLERGYTLTLDESGRVVRHAMSLLPGQSLLTRFADGTARSIVDRVEASEGLDSPVPARSGLQAPATGRPGADAIGDGRLPGD